MDISVGRDQGREHETVQETQREDDSRSRSSPIRTSPVNGKVQSPIQTKAAAKQARDHQLLSTYMPGKRPNIEARKKSTSPVAAQLVLSQLRTVKKQ